jgi:vacuolar-type H+-ATPase subunit H
MSIDELIQEEVRYAKTVEETKIKAKNIMANAEKEAEKIIEKASDKRHIREELENEEKKVKEEAKKIISKYEKKAASLNKVSPKEIQKSVDYIIAEVLKFE